MATGEQASRTERPEGLVPQGPCSGKKIPDQGVAVSHSPISAPTQARGDGQGCLEEDLAFTELPLPSPACKTLPGPCDELALHEAPAGISHLEHSEGGR